MKSKIATFLTTTISLIILVLSFALVLPAFAQTSISYPIAELNNCSTLDNCRAYCAEEENQTACRAFAKRHNLVRKIKTKITFPVPELGNCTDQQSCRDYCSLEENQTACRAFAEKHNIRIRKRVYNFIRNAQQQLGCQSLTECKAFCTNPDNQTNCREFGQAHQQLLLNQRQQIQTRLQQLQPTNASPSSAIQNNIRNRLQTTTATQPAMIQQKPSY